ncbi:hypothetical protein GCM10007875_19050 [Limnobacter litoralis]|uniref:Uncharacterized protein n=1 Tax=Limnobacter litoralis TaxID=481366 RepID=A0ABQ5YSP3_9BURK|nr:hypothetical protein GCM10007875_19050 [Limnobacter litoralis]
MHIEHIHEYRNLQRIALSVWIIDTLNSDDSAVCRGHYGVGLARNEPGGITKELQNKEKQDPGDGRKECKAE